MRSMSYRWIPIIATFLVMLIGHILSRVTRADYEKRAKKTAEFRDKFIDLANHYMEYHQVDPKLYQDCIREVDDIQAELGYDGIIAEFIDPLKSIKMTNMQVLVNVFPEMISMVSQLDSYIIQVRMSQFFQHCIDSMEKHIGRIYRLTETEQKQLWNPIACFGKGMRGVLSFPLDALYWLGFLNARSNRAIQNNGIFRLLGKFVTAVGFISSIMSIVLGWDEFVKVIMEIMQKVREIFPI